MHELEEWELIQIVIVYCAYEIITSTIAWLFFIFQGLTIPIGQLVVSHKTEYSKTPPLKGVSLIILSELKALRDLPFLAGPALRLCEWSGRTHKFFARSGKSVKAPLTQKSVTDYCWLLRIS